MSRRHNFLSFVAQHLSPVAPPGLVSHSDLDDRAIEALKEFNEEGALQVLLQFKDSDLSHVQVCVRAARADDAARLLCAWSVFPSCDVAVFYSQNRSFLHVCLFVGLFCYEITDCLNEEF